MTNLTRASDPVARPASETCREMLEGLLLLHSAPDLAAFFRASLHVLQHLLPSLFVSFHEVETGTARRRHACCPEEYSGISERILSLLPRSPSEEPVITPALNAQLRKISAGGVGNATKRADDPGISEVLALTFRPTPDSKVTFVLARSDPIFTDTDRNLAAVLQPHFVRAYEVAARAGERRGSEDDPASASSLLQRRFGLTRRQSELLYWLARGKSNREMATIFGISARTVDKHLQHVFEKLDVDSRHAALVQAFEAIGSA